jgi:hypothetical protein
VLGRKQKRPSQSWDGRRICVRGATQLRLTPKAQPHSISSARITEANPALATRSH